MALTRVRTGGVDTTVNPTFQLNQTSNQSLSDSTLTTMTWDASAWDTASITSVGSNNVTITAVTAGYWILYAVNRIGQRPNRQQLYILKGSTDLVYTENAINDAGSGANPSIQASWSGPLVTGDVLTVKAWQSSGGSQNTVADGIGVQFWGIRVRGA